MALKTVIHFIVPSWEVKVQLSFLLLEQFVTIYRAMVPTGSTNNYMNRCFSFKLNREIGTGWIGKEWDDLFSAMV